MQGQKGPALALCTLYQRTGTCLDSCCRFAHGEDELQRRERMHRDAQQKGDGGGAGGKALPAPKGYNYALAPAPRNLSPKVIEAMKTCVAVPAALQLCMAIRAR